MMQETMVVSTPNRMAVLWGCCVVSHENRCPALGHTDTAAPYAIESALSCSERLDDVDSGGCEMSWGVTLAGRNTPVPGTQLGCRCAAGGGSWRFGCHTPVPCDGLAGILACACWILQHALRYAAWASSRAISALAYVGKCVSNALQVHANMRTLVTSRLYSARDNVS